MTSSGLHLEQLPAELCRVPSELPQGTVYLRAGKEKPLLRGHPWVWDTSVERVDGTPADGDVVNVVTNGAFIGRGVFNSRSRLRVRLYTWSADQDLSASFWQERVESALTWRKRLQLVGPQQAVRLVFSESDGLSGLVVDQYGEHVVVQVNALAMAVRLTMLTELLVAMLQPASLSVRTAPSTEKAEGLPHLDGCLWGELPQRAARIVEHGVQFDVDLTSGQKTGYYIDQRDNRAAVAAYLFDRRVLDVFCYSGGFALHALVHGNARGVVGVDSSARALEMARHNAILNGVSERVEWVCSDAFEFLESQQAQGRRFDAVILDPPKFARNRYHIKEALRAYHRLNRLAVNLLEADSILVSCSCSGSVSRQDFIDMLFGVAEKSGRMIQVIEQRGQSGDHPVSLACPETEYLKCIVCRVI